MRLNLAIIIVCTLTACKNQRTDSEDWLKSHTVEIISTDPLNKDYADLDSIKSAIGDARIVLIGEQEHGDGATYSAKSRLVKFLHDEMGFNVLAFESDFYGVNKSWMEYKMGTKDYQEVLNRLYIFWNQSAMCLDLFQTIERSQQTSNPISIAGIDTRLFQKDFTQSIDSVLKYNEISIPISDNHFFNNTINEALEKYDDHKISSEDQIKFFEILDLIAIECRVKKVDSFWIQALDNLKGFMMHNWYWWIDRENDMVDNNHRDLQMAKNSLWLLNEKYKGEKIIIWAHNGHVLKTDTLFEVEVEGYKPDIRQYPMGEVLFDSLNKDLYSIGFTSFKGSNTNLNYDQEINEWKFITKKFKSADSLSLEFALKQIGYKYAFINLRGQSHPWLEKDRRMRVWRPDYIKGKLPNLYDGIFYIEEMKPNVRVE